MRWSSSAVFREVVAKVPRALASSRRLELCHTVAASVPPAAAAYFECRLNEDERVDYLLLTRDRLDAADRFKRARGGLSDSSVWEKNRGLLQAWSDNVGNLADIPLLWFEYDIDERFDERVMDASPSLCVERGYHRREIRAPSLEPRRARRLAESALERLWSGDAVSIVAALRCIDALPERGALVYVSSMLTRPECVTKVYVSLPKTSVFDYLRRISWPGDPSLLEQVLRGWYAPIAETVFIDVTVSDRVHARLGLALSQLHR
ncbi:MAG TPA: hypothetical protein VFQ35_12625, partial [Polyangiaceae bacterium]|nr:hypothetical protein [Polyangiaceae bacterium]